MNRIRIHETALGRGRFTGADDDTDSKPDKETDMTTTIKDQFFAEAAAREAELQRQIAGDFTPPSRPGDVDPTITDSVTTAVSGRDSFYARQAAMSRQPARGATREAVTDVEDDDEVSLPTASGRDAHQQREAQRSRLPARGAQ